MHVTIIGAGVSGLSIAIKCIKNNIDFTIYEKENYIGGLWNIKKGIVNEFSNIQVPAPSFKFEDDYTNYSDYTTTDELYKKIEENYIKFNIIKKIIFNTELVEFKSLDNGKVELQLKKNEDSNFFIQNITTDALYIRTGTLNNVRELILPNENKFSGIVNYGTNKDKDVIDFKDKIVTIIGFGATAVENINNAFKKGAKKVIVLARNLRNIWSRKMIYQILNELINPTHYLLDIFRKRSWDRVNKLYNKNIDYFNKDIIKKIRDDSTVLINNNVNHKMNKIPAVTEDILIYCYYDLLEIYNDEVIDIDNKNIKTKNNLIFESDIIFKCTGYELNENFLKNHRIDNTIFIDGKYNITHNCGLDRSGKFDYLLGPDTEVNVLPLISYPLVNHIFDELAIYFLQYPNRFNIFNKNKLYENIISNTNIENIEFRCYVCLFWKVIDYLKTSLLDLRVTLRIGLHLWNLRQDVLNNLNIDKFHNLDKKLWNETSEFCYKKNKNKDFLKYPYEK